ncbi:MAG: PAS domain S-box protein [Desulfobulbaceae bacterium]|nr:MAG: PAS domain S-box protein [Desulfobulbaceae bacterium]
MQMQNSTRQWLRFIFAIILPTLVAISISVGTIYIVILPSFEKSFLDSKKEMIQQLTNVAWRIMEYYYQEESTGRLSREQAQEKAASEIEHLRYGPDLKDYFWISDMTPTLIMHPYSKELVGTDLSLYQDATGKHVFMEIKNAVEHQQSSFIDYTWGRKYLSLQDVPKLSFVKKFEPWDWVVGTGMFLDDVAAKTAEITRRLTLMIYGAIILFTLLLVLVIQRSLLIEKRRRSAEHELRLSQEKYKALVDSAVDPQMMIHNGTCIYVNRSMELLLGYSGAELEVLDLRELFPAEMDPEESGAGVFEQGLHGYDVEGSKEGVLLRSDGREVIVSLSMTRKNFGTQKVIVVTARDISDNRQIEEQLDESREKYRLLTDRLSIGVFRTMADKSFRLLEMNPVASSFFGIDRQLLPATDYPDLLDILEKDQWGDSLYETLEREGVVKDWLCRVVDKSGKSRVVSISMIVTKGRSGRWLYCDGLIEDVSLQQKSTQEREDLIVELQTSLMFLNQPVGNVDGGFISCPGDTPIKTAAKLMTEADKSSILVEGEDGEKKGIITDLVLRDRVVGEEAPLDTPVEKVMSSPLIHVEETALIFEAVMLMQERNIKHLVVQDRDGQVSNVISNEELLDIQRYSSAFLIKQIRKTENIEEIVDCQKRLPRIIKALNDSGAHANNITRIITTVSDAIVERLIDFAIEEVGEPPTRFAFISLGSEGREEQTLVTDQDNALIFEDVPEEKLETVKAYYLRFSEMICTWLDQAGYDFCKGNVMAMNPEWCQPISIWKGYFTKWVTDATPEDLMEVSIFFDFRCLYGDNRFIGELRSHIADRAENRAAFLYQLAQNTLLFKVPVDFFGNLTVEGSGEHVDTFNIKHVMAQVVGFARIYAIHCSIEATNTLQRIDELLDTKILNKASHEELVEAYNYLMQLRFRHQVSMLDSGSPPDNHVHIKELSHMEKDVLEKVLAQVNNLRKRMSLIGHNEIYF